MHPSWLPVTIPTMLSLNGLLSFLGSGKQATSVVAIAAIIWMAVKGLDWKYCLCVAIVGIVAVVARAFTETKGKAIENAVMQPKPPEG